MNSVGTKKKLLSYTIAVCLGIMIFCMCLNLTGAVLSDIMTDYKMNLDSGGLMSFYQYAGGLAAILVISRISDHLKKPLLLVGAFVVVAVMLCCNSLFPPFALFMILYLVMGAALGVVDTNCTAIIMDVQAKNADSWLSLLHGFAGIGATILPIITVIMGTGNWQVIYRVVAIIVAAIIVMQLVIYFRGRKEIDAAAPSGVKSAEALARQREGKKRFFRDKNAWLLLAAQFCSGAGQAGVTVWSVKYCRDIFPDMGSLAWALSLSAYWAGAMVSRLSFGFVPKFKKMNSRSVIIVGGIGSGAALLLGVISGNYYLLLAGIFLNGIFSGVVMPRLSGIMSRKYPNNTGLASGMVFSATYIGYALVPLFMGFVAAAVSMNFMMIFPIVTAALSGVLVIALPKKY